MINKIFKILQVFRRRTTILTKNYYNLFYFFLFNKRSKIVKFQISADLLYAYLHVDPIHVISERIEFARNCNLEYLDSLMSADEFWKKDWPKEYKPLEYLLKIGWLVEDIRKNGIQNPIQLIQSGPNKYALHPGTARSIVVTYLIPQKSIPVFYVWDTALDPCPFLLDHEYEIVNNYRSFLKMFKRSSSFKILTCRLTETLNCSDGGDYAYFDLAQKNLKRSHGSFDLNFITVQDIGHWQNQIKQTVYFKNLIEFTDDNTCIFAGLCFVKINEKWIAAL
jgi:hypothetical protein